MAPVKVLRTIVDGGVKGSSVPTSLIVTQVPTTIVTGVEEFLKVTQVHAHVLPFACIDDLIVVVTRLF